MARPLRDGLLYFPFDVDFFQDKKIKILRGRYGSDGILVYLYLLCEMYKNNGYYVILDEDLILCISDDLNASEALTRQIISFLLSRSLLCEIKDSTLAKSDTVLTAKSVQQRYQEAKKGLKRDVAVKAKYWVLKSEDTLSFIKVHPENGLSEKNNHYSGKNGNKTANNDTKKSKEKESKGKYMSIDGAELLTAEQKQELVAMSDCRSVEKYIVKIQDWQRQSGKKCRNPYETIKGWIEKDIKPHKCDEHSYDLDEWEKYAMNFNPNRKKGGA